MGLPSKGKGLSSKGLRVTLSAGFPETIRLSTSELS